MKDLYVLPAKDCRFLKWRASIRNFLLDVYFGLYSGKNVKSVESEYSNKYNELLKEAVDRHLFIKEGKFLTDVEYLRSKIPFDELIESQNLTELKRKLRYYITELDQINRCKKLKDQENENCNYILLMKES